MGGEVAPTERGAIKPREKERGGEGVVKGLTSGVGHIFREKRREDRGDKYQSSPKKKKKTIAKCSRRKISVEKSRGECSVDCWKGYRKKRPIEEPTGEIGGEGYHKGMTP